MDQDICKASIFIGNKGKDIKKAMVLNVILTMIFTCIVSTGVYAFLHPSILMICGVSILVFLFSLIGFSSFLSMNIRYFEITEHEVIIADSTQFRIQYQMLLNVLFKTHYEVETVRFSLCNIDAVKIYAIEDTRYTRFTNYDGHTSKGYRVWIKLYLSDHSSFILKDWFYYKHPNVIRAFEYLEENDINIIDHQQILEIIKKDLSLNDILNKKVSL
ncbi:hypothetical protein [Amedibacillus sp. YH-ame10]